MRTIYVRTQIGYVTFVLTIAGIIAVTLWLVVGGFTWVGFIALVGLDLALILFSTLTIEISDGILSLTFGPGIIRKRIALNDVVDCHVVRNPRWHGWGIRRLPAGWLYQVSGKLAVELTLRSGKHCRIRTDVPHELVDAIRRAMVVDAPSDMRRWTELHPAH